MVNEKDTTKTDPAADDAESAKSSTPKKFPTPQYLVGRTEELLHKVKEKDTTKTGPAADAEAPAAKSPTPKKFPTPQYLGEYMARRKPSCSIAKNPSFTSYAHISFSL